MFFINETVVSKRTGLRWTVLGYDEPTLDGAEVVILGSPGPNVVVAALAEGFVSLEE
jgi:hypothetical protein